MSNNNFWISYNRARKDRKEFKEIIDRQRKEFLESVGLPEIGDGVLFVELNEDGTLSHVEPELLEGYLDSDPPAPATRSSNKLVKDFDHSLGINVNTKEIGEC